MTYTIAAFYLFVSLPVPDALGSELRAMFGGSDLRGTMLIAGEGINGTMAGSAATIEQLLSALIDKVGLDREQVKFSFSDIAPFQRLKFLVRPEIIPFRRARVHPTQAGKYVEPQDWNALIAEPEVLLLDTRNRYETDLGSFAGATVPGTGTFSEFVTYVRENLDPSKHRRIAMFCTGGIRCEKASAFMLQEGFEEVHHLKGGILKYLEEMPEPNSRWRGACYVFDRRTSVTHADFQDQSASMGQVLSE